MINARDDGGWIPLAMALLEREEEAAVWLIENGADVTSVDDDRETIFACACQYVGPRVGLW